MPKRVMGMTAQRDKNGQFYNKQPIYDDFDESEEMTETDKQACADFAKWLFPIFIQQMQENN